MTLLDEIKNDKLTIQNEYILNLLVTEIEGSDDYVLASMLIDIRIIKDFKKQGIQLFNEKTIDIVKKDILKAFDEYTYREILGY